MPSLCLPPARNFTVLFFPYLNTTDAYALHQQIFGKMCFTTDLLKISLSDACFGVSGSLTGECTLYPILLTVKMEHGSILTLAVVWCVMVYTGMTTHVCENT